MSRQKSSSPDFSRVGLKKIRTPIFRQRPDNPTPEELLEYLIDKWNNYHTLIWDVPSKQVLLFTQKELSDLFALHPILKLETEIDKHTWYVLKYCEYEFKYNINHKTRMNWLKIKRQIESFDFGMRKF